MSPPPPVFRITPTPETKTPLVTSEPNHIKIVVDGEKLQIMANNIDLVGLNRLRKQLDKYAEILKLTDEEDVLS